MKKIIALITSIILVLAIAVPTSAISSTTKKPAAKKEKIRIAVWDATLAAREFSTLINAFNAQSKTTQVEMANLPGSNYSDKMAIILASGPYLDGAAIKDMTLYSSTLRKNQLAPLDDYIAKNKFDLTDYGSFTDVFKSNGKIMGIPYRSDFYIMYYNKGIFDKAKLPYPSDDMTWDQYRELAKKLTSGEGSDKIWGAYFQTQWAQMVADFATATRKGDLASGSYGYLKPAYETVLGMQQEDKSAMTYAAIKTSGTTYRTLFESGKVAMHVNGTWHIGQLIGDKKAGLFNFRWGVAKAPHFADSKPGSTCGSVTPFAMFKTTKKGDNVFEFMSFICGEQGASILGNLGFMPGFQSQSVIDTLANTDGFPKECKSALNTSDKVLEIPPHKNSAQIMKILGEENELILTKAKTIDEGLKEFEARTKDIVADK